MISRVLLATVFTLTLHAQEKQFPRFSDYPAASKLEGSAANPLLPEKWQRLFRTRIRQGVTLGWGVRHFEGDGPFSSLELKSSKKRIGNSTEGSGPNYAGHYFVVTWGCGSDCLSMAIVNGKTGRVFPPPLSVDGQNPQSLPYVGPWQIANYDFRVDSKLFMMETCETDKFTNYTRVPCRTSYFIIEDKGFRLIREIRWKRNYDTDEAD